MEEFRHVALSDCYESPLNTRRHFDPVALKDLTNSVRTKGVLTPVLMRERETRSGRYEILAGARRCRAAKAAGLDEVPAIVRALSDDEALEVVVIENLQRQDVHPLEEADGYKALVERPGYDVAAIATKVGKSESYVYQRLKLTDLIEPARKAFVEHTIGLGHALLIARLQAGDQATALEQATRKQWNGKKDVTVAVPVADLARHIEEEILRDLAKASFNTKDPDLVPAAGACPVCPKRSGATPALFPDITKGDVCTDGACFKAKVAAHIERSAAELAAAGTAPLRLSTEYGGGKKGVLGRGSWDQVKPKSCPSARKGIIVETSRWSRDDATQLGRVLVVCADAKCKVHRGKYSHSTASDTAWKARQAKDREKRDRQRTINGLLFAAIVEKAPTTIGRTHYEVLALKLLDDHFEDAQVPALGGLLGVEPPTKALTWNVREKFLKGLKARIPELSDAELARLLAVAPLLDTVDGFADDGGRLAAAATGYGVDVEGITKGVDAELKVKRDAAKARKLKKAKKEKAKGRTKEAAPAATDDPQCEICECTEDAACTDGCAWDPTFQKKGRFVCTTPACVKSAKKAKKAATK